MLELGLRLAVSLGVVLGLFWLVARTGAKKLGGSRALLRVHGRQSLSRTASVAVVEVGSRVLVVGVSEGGVRLLTELDPEEIAEPEAVVVDGAVAPRAPGARRAARSPLGGSMLSAQTWKQAWAAATTKPLPATSVAEGNLHD
jgi:flagellar protein FliO/FliZ